MEQAQKNEYSKLARIAFIIWIISLISFFVVAVNVALPFFQNNYQLIKLFSNLLTIRNFSFFSSLFLLTSITSLILSFMARKEIRLYKKLGRKIAKFTSRASILEIIIFLILLAIYFVR